MSRRKDIENQISGTLTDNLVGGLQLVASLERAHTWMIQAASLGLELNEDEELVLFEIAHVVTGRQLGSNLPQMNRSEAEELLAQYTRDPRHHFWRTLIEVRFPVEETRFDV